MTNVPGFIPKPYPIVIFPGTFVIILQTVAVDFYPIMKNKFDEKFSRTHFFGVEKSVSGKCIVENIFMI